MELKSILGYLRNKTILVTGSTGFLAMVFVEKILRAQPDVKKIYLLIRDSGTKSATDRMYNEIIEKELFRVLREKYGTDFNSFISEKLAAVAGDVSFEDLVKEVKLREEMYNEVEIIVNSAGTTTFDERYDIALAVNTFGVQHVMDFAKKCSKLEMLLHVSTAYICGVRAGVIPEDRSCMDEMVEKSAGLDFKQVEKNLVQEKLKELIAQDATKEEITAIMKDFGIERAKHHGWPNTYVFTKAMGEMLLSVADIPHVIIRPTVITSTIEEPFPGWIQGFRTIDSVIAFYGKGKLTCLLVDPFSVFDMIPVDMLVNSMIVAIVANAKQSSKMIYHVGSSFRNPVTFFELHDYIYGYFINKPWINKDGTPVKVRAGLCFQTMSSFRMYMNIRYFLPLQGLRIVNKVFRQHFQDMYDQWHTKLTLAMRLVGLYEPYMTFKGIFDDTNTEDLRRIARESFEDAEDFKFDPKSINWDDYFSHIHIPGLRKHVMTKR